MEQPRKTELEKRLEAEMLSKADEEIDASQEDVEAAEAETPEAAPGVEPESTGQALQEVGAERDALKDQLLRARAEFDNYRKRMAREADRVRKTAGEGLVRDLLPVLDHLELALQHGNGNSAGLAEGVELVVKQFMDVLNRWGVEPIPAAGQPFDPNFHEAVMQRASDECPANVVLEEFQKGYRMGQLVLRPAKVVVSAGPAAAESEAEFAEAPSMDVAPEQQTD